MALWHALHPYGKALVAGLTGSTVIVLGAVLTGMLLDLVDASVANWGALKGFILSAWLIGSAVVGVAYWMFSPAQTIWTKEELEMLRKIRAGQL